MLKRELQTNKHNKLGLHKKEENMYRLHISILDAKQHFKGS